LSTHLKKTFFITRIVCFYRSLFIAKAKRTETSLYNKDDEKYRFDGSPIKLSYKAPEDITIRIYDISGKININMIKSDQLKKILAQKLGEHNKQIPELIDAWFDWTDTDNLKRLNGAEKAYYDKQKTAYQPRNGAFVDVNEVLWIKGFDKVFDESSLEAIFSIWGDRRTSVNANTATKEVLMILPGMSESLAAKIIATRSKQKFKTIAELNVLFSPVETTKLNGWFHLNESNFYSIFVYPTKLEQKEQPGYDIYGYREDVRVVNQMNKPSVLRVNPYAKITVHTSPKAES